MMNCGKIPKRPQPQQPYSEKFKLSHLMLAKSEIFAMNAVIRIVITIF